ncbi:MAG: hypothetical protein PHD95_01295 [Candidatus ainarchaeum sp.]|nr:hypothetical protein [Candidatus ainarchaeum sp.]
MNKKNNRGQSSFDFLIAIVFAIIFFQAFSVISGQVIALQEETAIRAQTKEIALNTALIISASQALNERNADFEIAYQTPKVKTLGDAPGECTITVTASEVQVKLGTDPPEKAALIQPSGIKINNNFTPAVLQLNCGETISITSIS